MASVTIRTPEGSVVMRCSLTAFEPSPRAGPSAAVGIAVPRAPAAVAPAALAVAPAAAVAAVAPAAAVAAGTATPTAARAHAGQLVHRLPGDGGVVRQPQADPPALAVDLDHTHLDLLAAVEHVVDGLDALARGDVR